jgi:hypothetical protein
MNHINTLSTKCRIFLVTAVLLKTCRWVDNVKMDLREIGWGGMD